MYRGVIFVRILSAIFIGFIISFYLLRLMIKKNINGQIERDYLDSHKLKSGTPSSGGIAFFLSTSITFLITSIGLKYNYKLLSLIFASGLFFAIGLMDDLFKKKFKSYNGLSAKTRILLEIIVLIYSIIILKNTPLDLYNLYLPLTEYKIDISKIYILFFAFILIGTSNSINLTDGLDGLASGLVMICISPFILLSLINKEYLLALYLSSLIGALLAFVYYNFYPAKIFMGDCGSLYLGSVLALTSIILRNEIILFISGFLFVLETISVIIQVIYFKCTKKRVFLMTPLHHHYEKKGYEETSVVMGFYLIGVFLSILSIIIEVI